MVVVRHLLAQVGLEMVAQVATESPQQLLAHQQLELAVVVAPVTMEQQPAADQVAVVMQEKQLQVLLAQQIQAAVVAVVVLVAAA